jgi:hypothetical protein
VTTRSASDKALIVFTAHSGDAGSSAAATPAAMTPVARMTQRKICVDFSNIYLPFSNIVTENEY